MNVRKVSQKLETLTKSDKAKNTPGNPETLCGASDVMIIHETEESLIRFSLQYRCVLSPQFTMHRLMMWRSVESGLVDLSRETNEELPEALYPLHKQDTMHSVILGQQQQFAYSWIT